MNDTRHAHRLSDLRGAFELAGDGFDQITARIHEFHRAISDQPMRGLAPLPATAPVRALHDGITDGVYATVRLTGAAVFGAAAVLLRQAERLPTRAALPSSSARGRDLVAGALAGFVGDHAVRRRNPLMPRLGFYQDGRRLSLDNAALDAAFPQANGKLVVFVHGLACTEHSWRLYEEADRPETMAYGGRLAGEFGYTPLYLRYNSGLHISKNGRGLARALARLSAAWPTQIDEIALVGHSMGGLVARAAAAHGLACGDAWAGRVSRVVCLGSPHRGAPLEQAVDGLTRVLDRFELSRPWGRVLGVRSVGIRDLKHGATSDADWRDGRSRRWRSPQPITRLPGARYHFIGSSIGVAADDPLGRFLGDGLVRLSSSVAEGLADADTATLFRLHHMQLLNHPAVYARLRAIFERR